MARDKQADDLLLDDELAAAFLADDEPASEAVPAVVTTVTSVEEEYDAVPGQLAVDVYETEDKLVVKARTAGVNKSDLDVSIADGVLTISGTLSAGDDTAAIKWHVQECYWGEFSRTLVLPIPVKEDEVEAVLKDGVLTISFNKVKEKAPKRVVIQ
jgi:HSP20 family protein